MESKDEQIIANILLMIENVPVQGSDNIAMWQQAKTWLQEKAAAAKPKSELKKAN